MRSIYWRTSFGKRRTGLANGTQVWQMAHRFGKWHTGLANFEEILA